jgi:uncharacterized protein
MSKPRTTDRTRVRRLPKRGHYDRGTIHAILDEGLVCHVGFVHEGHPFVIPTLYARDGERLLVHGSAASRMLTTLEGGADACITVTLADSIVVARSVFHSSMNYRSVMMLGKLRSIEEPDAKMRAIRALVEHLIPGRWDDARSPNPTEMKATSVLEMPIDEASAKMRTGPALDEEEDYALPYWAGVLPFARGMQAPVRDPKLKRGITAPRYIERYRRPKEGERSDQRRTKR